MVGGCYENSVYILIFKKLAIVKVSFGFVAFLLADVCRTGDSAFITVTYRRNLDVILSASSDKASDMAGTHAADANHAESNTVVGAEHRR